MVDSPVQSLFPDDEQATYSGLNEIDRDQLQLADQVIMALSGAVEAKDRYTNGHSQRVAEYSMEIARRIGWDPEKCLRTYYAGILHDIGKISVPDSILNKTDKLTDAESNAMKLHTTMGYYILKEISTISEFAIGARWHHERYDGMGYPNGLSRDNIPLISRIISVADAYDSMTSSRSYRDVLPRDYVRSEIKNGLGTQFDPHIGAIMLEMIEEDVDYLMRQRPMRTNFNILAIDDDPIELKLLDFIISKEGKYQLTKALSGEEGIEIFKSSPVDLVLLDVEMPGMNGFDVLEWIRNTNKDVPVIFMTGEKDMGNIMKAEAMGVSDYLTKPVVPHILVESIQNMLFSNLHCKTL